MQVAVLQPYGVQGLVPPKFTGVGRVPMLDAGDMRAITNTHGSITTNAIVKVKPEPDSPQLPLAGAKVSVHDVHDGTVRWAGRSVEGGHYYPAGLTPGAVYFVAAQDMTGTFEAVAAGPVVAEAKLWPVVQLP